ncbi:hypothetical protein FQN49_003817 [Arthroderma sp. PD_2]|nr:hypothetical protein FQN49_003817 [Arthroderma sp. PD_2]
MTVEGFPSHPLFKQLVEHIPLNDGIIIHDPDRGIKADYNRFLNDVLSLRRSIREQIPDLLDSYGIVRDEGVYICTLAPASYDFFVAAIAILAVGAALTPLATGITPKEARYLVENCKSVLLIASSGQRDAAAEIQRCMKDESGHSINTIGLDFTAPTPYTQRTFYIDEHAVIPVERPTLLNHTSGTTGPPKGVVRKIHPIDFRALIDGTNDDLTLCHRAVHWGFGIGPPLGMILNGMSVYIVAPNPSPKQIWEALRQKILTIAFATNLTYLRLMQYYDEHLAGLEPDVVKEYVEGVKKLKYVVCGGAVPMPGVGQFWKDMRGGHPITILFGTSEAGASLGTPPEGYDLSKAIATKASLNEDGFYKTGDLAHIGEDGNYVVDGRVSEDFIMSSSLKVGTLELEDKLSELPYISEAAVIAVPDIEVFNRVAVIARMRPSSQGCITSNGEGHPPNMLYKVRRDLTELKVALYKLPTLLRILGDDEIIPRTTTDKVIRKKVIETFFPQSADCKVEDLPKEVLVWDSKNDKKAGPTGLWDWGGAQD